MIMVLAKCLKFVGFFQLFNTVIFKRFIRHINSS